MGIFSYNIRSILEVKRKVNGQEEDLDKEEQDDNNEPEQNDTSNNEEPQTTSNDTTSEENSEDEHTDNNPEANNYNMGDIEDDDSNEEESDEQSEDENSEANDYSMGDIEDEESDTDDTSNEESTDDTTSSQGSENELKSLEDDLFKDIAPEQMNIKIMELKKQYLEVYATVTDVLGRTNKIPKTSHNMSVLEFITNKLMELKDIVQFYLSNTFDTKTYVENMVNYQQYLATLNTINRLLKEISRKKENNT